MLRPYFCFILICLFQYNSGAVAQTAPELVFPATLDGVVRLNVSAIPNQNERTSDDDLLSVFVENELEVYNSNAIQGQYTRDGNYLCFKPFFPFEAELTYIVRSTNYDSTYCFRSFQLGAKSAVEGERVLGIYPSANELPENLLRFYIYFNTPMKKGQALTHVQLLDSAGNIDHHAFMEFKQELWSADGKRLTILFDPGRIKRGVSTNLLRGPALHAGKRYSLRIAGAWKDVYGQELAEDTRKEIVVVSPYRRQMKVDQWVVNIPHLDSQDTLSIRFDRLLDYALIQSMIQLEDEERNHIEGHWEILEQEQSIQFAPVDNWRKGNYQILIDSRLEDIAGNSLQNLLDHIETGGESNDQLYRIIEFKI